MKLTEFVIVITAALLFLIPSMNRESKNQFLPEAQEEEEQQEVSEVKVYTFRVTYESRSPEEEPIADIIWMKRAAEVADSEGIPYFNVLEQNIRKKYVKKFDRKLSVVEGVIQLEKDPMKAEYDAREIESLVLNE